MISKQAITFRALLSVAALSAAGLMSVPAQAQLLGGSATGGLGGTLSPRQLDASGQLGVKAQRPRGEPLRETAGQTTGAAAQAAAQARGSVNATTDKAVQLQGAAVGKAVQAQGMVSGTAGTTAKDVSSQATQAASAEGSASVKREDGGVSASASGEAKAKASR